MKPPYPKYVICPDVEGLPHYLTAGKRYAVRRSTESDFRFTDDDGDTLETLWEASDFLNGADWIIPEDETPEEDPPEWAVKLACERAEINRALRGTHLATKRSIKAHARTIAKYEQEPVDPDLVLAREIAAQDAERSDFMSAAKECRAGSRDSYRMVRVPLTTIKHIRKHGLPS